ncbi:MAG: elongation factor P [Holosporaceae bacterium]|jgi:elongation factor P|nr:elongation factor P [Holosporaceae bacterium]
MKISGNELRIGMMVEHNGRLWTVCKLQHVKPGKGGAYMQAELKEIKTGTKLNERFRSDESLERVRLDEEEGQLLFRDGDVFTFMNMATFDQLQIHKDVIGDSVNFLQDNMIVKVSIYEGQVIGVVLPDTVIMEVVQADAVVKGQTATSSYKPAMLENGMRILVPPHIESGTKIVVNIFDASYVERAKQL